MSSSSIRTLLLYAEYTTRLSYYDDWTEAFERSSRFAVTKINICQKGILSDLKKEVSEADLIVLLHSTNGDTTIYLEPFANVLADRRGTLLSFVGNEVNLPGSPIGAKRDVLAEIRPDFIATQLPIEAGEFLWGDLVQNSVLAVPHALNPDAFYPILSDADRVIDIGVRAVRYLPHLGDGERNNLHDLFSSPEMSKKGLNVNISTERLNRKGWAQFLNNCRGTVSSEAGSWWVERDDAIINEIRTWTAERTKGKVLVIPNDSPLRKIGHKLPWQLRAFLKKVLSSGVVQHESSLNEQMEFGEIYSTFFEGRPCPPFYAKCISSRHFDAIGTQTCQILVNGRYNDILKADEHYISLASDYSNLDDVLDRFGDVNYRSNIAKNAHQYVMAHHTYDHRIAELVHAIEGDLA